MRHRALFCLHIVLCIDEGSVRHLAGCHLHCVRIHPSFSVVNNNHDSTGVPSPIRIEPRYHSSEYR